MTFRVFTLVCLFIIPLRFPANKSVANIIRERYGNAALKASEARKIRFQETKSKVRYQLPGDLSRCESDPHISAISVGEQCFKKVDHLRQLPDSVIRWRNWDETENLNGPRNKIYEVKERFAWAPVLFWFSAHHIVIPGKKHHWIGKDRASSKCQTD